MDLNFEAGSGIECAHYYRNIGSDPREAAKITSCRGENIRDSSTAQRQEALSTTHWSSRPGLVWRKLLGGSC
jgi:hypothetical protein